MHDCHACGRGVWLWELGKQGGGEGGSLRGGEGGGRGGAQHPRRGGASLPLWKPWSNWPNWIRPTYSVISAAQRFFHL